MSDLPQSGRLFGFGMVAVVVCGLGAIFLYLQSAAESELSGSLTIDDSTFTPQHCRSGKIDEDGPRDRPRFLGVDLLVAGDSARVVRVMEDPMQGTTVLIVDPGEAPRAVERSACERFDVQLHETGELIMEVWGMEGSIDLECPDVSGQVRFESCFSGR